MTISNFDLQLAITRKLVLIFTIEFRETFFYIKNLQFIKNIQFEENERS